MARKSVTSKVGAKAKTLVKKAKAKPARNAAANDVDPGFRVRAKACKHPEKHG